MFEWALNDRQVLSREFDKHVPRRRLGGPLRIYEPDDPFDICEPMHAWCTQWEDEPDNRTGIEAAITTALSEFLTRHGRRHS